MVRWLDGQLPRQTDPAEPRPRRGEGKAPTSRESGCEQKRRPPHHAATRGEQGGRVAALLILTASGQVFLPHLALLGKLAHWDEEAQAGEPRHQAPGVG